MLVGHPVALRRCSSARSSTPTPTPRLRTAAATAEREGRIVGRCAGDRARATGGTSPPIVVADVDPATSTLWRDELFGPLLVRRAGRRPSTHAIALANDTDYALTAGCWSRSPANLRRAAAELRAGNVYLNRHTTGAVVGRQPFGGYGMSGRRVEGRRARLPAPVLRPSRGDREHRPPGLRSRIVNAIGRRRMRQPASCAGARRARGGWCRGRHDHDWFTIEIGGIAAPGGSATGWEGRDGRTVLAAAVAALRRRGVARCCGATRWRPRSPSSSPAA